jgi:two-component system chemotaxis response regulator CheY
MGRMIDQDSCILIADDMLTSRKLIIKILTDFGYTKFLEAADGEEAWNKLVSAKDDVKIILCDWYMPKLDGLGLLKKFKANPKLNKTLFIMVTSEADVEKANDAVAAGANGYITKPFDGQVLRHAINLAIKGSEK